MRYNEKSMGMLNRDMLKRDLFFFLIAIIAADFVIFFKMDPSFGGYNTMRLLATILTPVIVIALVLFLIITKPKRLISDAIIDAAEEFDIYIPEDATNRIVRDLFPELSKGKTYACFRGDDGFDTVCSALRNLNGARSTIEPDYPRLNIVIHTVDGEHLLETFQENITFGGTIYRVRQKDLDALFFNDSFPKLFAEKQD